MHADVFISHANEDHEIALELREALEAAGVPCWIAPECIPPGHDWPELVAEALEQCPIFLFLHSPAANASKQVRREVIQADEADAILLRVNLVQGERLDIKLRHYFLRSQYVDAFAGDTWKDELVSTVLRELRGDPVEDVPAEEVRIAHFGTYSEALGSTGRWGQLVPLAWWLVCGILPAAAIVMEYGDDGVFLGKLWPHFFIYPVIVGFLVPVCLAAPVRYLLAERKLGLPILLFVGLGAAYVTYTDVAAGDPALWEYDDIQSLRLVRYGTSLQPDTAVVGLPGTPRLAGRPVIDSVPVMLVARTVVRDCPNLTLAGKTAGGVTNPACDTQRQALSVAMKAWRDGTNKRWSATHWAYVLALFVHVFTLGLGVASIALLLRMRLQRLSNEPALYGLMAIVFFMYFLWLPFRIVSLYEKTNLFGEIKPLTELPITLIVVLCYAVTFYLGWRAFRSWVVYVLMTVAGAALLYVAVMYPGVLFYIIGRSSDPMTYPMITIVLVLILWPLLGGGSLREQLPARALSRGR
ncbi:toll/interleukin-1 receptor domain-containing protein [Longimicrobium sp.]|uniref:toll/interleukin-1 receptor domain-containing protein n=1 Tax=Longimicrobium sp. TaxID=2029185 RepID=UPI002E371C5C|nr:toll/interleukin-1 receptor domain-containing protein [Longimicrobium sp.]HEX6039851.1 toll/interleukin-1 receptor domain-containing protein [Longimicrobium sp.]